MRPTLVLLLILTLTIVACGGMAPASPSTLPPATVTESTSTPKPSLPTLTPTIESTATATAIPAGVIHVDTLDQEVYPFIVNGKCSLAEAIIAANSGKTVDTCAAGVLDESVIELMPGTYTLTQLDKTPQQAEWAYSTRTVGDGLPAIVHSMTIHGNGAIIQRDASAEPFRFLEVLYGTLAIKDLTLQGGDVGKDWGGAIYSFNASMNLDNIKLLNNHAENGAGLYFDLGALDVSNSEFSKNTASFGGAGIYVTSSRVNIASATFDGNTGNGFGTGMYASGVTLFVADSLFVRNHNDGTRGGGLYAEHVNLTVTRSQFYQNYVANVGGGILVANAIVNGTDTSDGDPIDNFEQNNPMSSELLTLVPGLEATLEASPSGVFQELVEAGEIHDSCFANNSTDFPGDPNWTAAIGGKSEADSNYWGDPSGPSGMGPGRGDNVGKKITFQPFLKEIPEYCDPTLAKQK